LAAGALPWTPLRELTALPKPVGLRGERSKERRGKEMRGGKKE